MSKGALAVSTLLVALALTPAADATVSVVISSPDPELVYQLDDTITLTVYVTADAGETDYRVYGAIRYPTDLVTPTSMQQNALPGGWTQNALSCYADACMAFTQVAPGPTAVNVTDFLISTLTFKVIFPDYASDYFRWQITPPTQSLDFFGVTDAPLLWFDLVVPEPTTAALLCAGLVGLAAARRRAR